MSTFSSLTIHDFCTERGPVAMHRARTLPSLRYVAEPTPFIPSERWPSSTPVPTTGRHLELQLLNKVAEGRIGLVHSVKQCRGSATLIHSSGRPEASPIPRRFGFFTIPIADCIPWDGVSMKRTDGVDWLPDDVYDYCFDPDDGGYKASSPWDKWKFVPEQRLVAVLVMEKLGEPCYIGRVDIVEGMASVSFFEPVYVDGQNSIFTDEW
ncbi:hypothetical protein IW262DRAFT_1497635 [Armillaria fumosa]|nr:hypothetical protein IW262DRAFT_1497635 [Armillaria fumosa]